jgi:hypothetical protein
MYGIHSIPLSYEDEIHAVFTVFQYLGIFVRLYSSDHEEVLRTEQYIVWLAIEQILCGQQKITFLQ